MRFKESAIINYKENQVFINKKGETYKYMGIEGCYNVFKIANGEYRYWLAIIQIEQTIDF